MCHVELPVTSMRVRAIAPNLTHLLPIHTRDLVTLSHINWAQFGHFHLGVYSLLWPAFLTLMAVCVVILRRQQMYTVIQAVHPLLYIVAKCNFFSVVTWKDIKYLQKGEGCIFVCSVYIYVYINTHTIYILKIFTCIFMSIYSYNLYYKYI